jgi:predicted transcriptional regulator
MGRVRCFCLKINQFKFNEKGLNRFFGPLESKIMSILWDGEEMTIKNVQVVLEKEKKVSFNTVMTVMNRLVEKKILQKRIEGRSSLYKPFLSKEVFLETQSKELTHELMDEFGSLVVSHMLDALEDVDQGLVEKLEQKIKDWKKEK